MERAFPMEARMHPSHPQRAAAATQSECACRHSSSNWQKRWGDGEAGMESEEGTAF